MRVTDRLLAHRDKMTPSERQLISVLLDDYPMAGLGSITELASAASVSTTTVARMLQKTGFDGYPQFQAALRGEVKEMISGPIAKRDVWQNDLPEEHILNRYSQQTLANQKRTIDEVDPTEFDSFCNMLSDPDRRIFITGGRITGTLAQYLYLHLQMIRPDVRLLPFAASWTHDLLDVRKGDVLIALDVRRYENSTMLIGQLCQEREAEIVLFTDQWRSPIHRLAKHTFTARIAVPSAWDSMAAIVMLLECVIAEVQERLWDSVKERTDELEQAFDRTKLFRKFGQSSSS
ncbi:DNA-binding transcriptional regulator HexR [Ruegeria denitrificans]|uniref:DNA-binding transcriptional regulator HexR n=1 Tax=Ruegeria denitrificans TaxID=1715692 RepID=A0A0P1IDC7_9RHOB|nr:MurR/RpiR family transcriptional regulator [Ruegeria denitrificans]CUK06714.1 DNA-binding transcriptional regulator HexR [Ruegeria denitrificans]